MGLTGGTLANQTLAALPAAFFQYLRRHLLSMGYSDTKMLSFLLGP